MELIQGFSLQHLPNDVHFTFGEATLKKAQEDEVVSVRCTNYLVPFAAAMQEEDDALVEAQGSQLSPAIREWDSSRDVTYDSFHRMLKALNLLPNPAIKVATEKVLYYVKLNKVDTSAQYDRESGQITNLVQDLEKYCTSELSLLNLSQFVADLKEANNMVKEKLAERADERATRILQRVKKARKKVDECYRALVQAINSMTYLDYPATPFKPFNGYMNAEITRLKREVLKIHVSQKEETGEEDSVTPPTETPGTDQTPGAGESGTTEHEARFMHNGSLVATQSYRTGATIVPPTPPTNYVWADCPATMPDHDITVVTEWDINQPPPGTGGSGFE